MQGEAQHDEAGDAVRDPHREQIARRRVGHEKGEDDAEEEIGDGTSHEWFPRCS